MTFCENCGRELQESDNYCEECGQKVGAPVPTIKHLYFQSELAPNFDNVYGSSYSSVTYGQSITEVISQIPKKVLISGICGFIGIVIIVIAVVYSSTVINMNKYLDVTFNGYDGYGKAEANIDWDAISEKYGMETAISLSSNIDLDVSPESDLENGEVVDYSWDADKADLKKEIKKYSVTFHNDSIVVDGLQEVEEVDIFNNVNVRFFGVSPYGQVEVDTSNSGLDDYYFSIDKTDGLSNGDTVTISLTDENVEDYIDLIGGIPKEMYKIYDVNDLGHYVTSISDISDDTKEILKKDAESKLSEMEENYDSVVTVNSNTFIGDYILIGKDDSASYSNCYGLVYKVDDTVNINDASPATNVTQYINFEYYNISVNDSNENGYDFDDYYRTSHSFRQEITNTDSWLGYSTYNFNGYQSIQELRSNEVDDVADQYTAEFNVEGSDETVTSWDSPDGYILPNSSTDTLTEEMLINLSAQQLTYARNEIYARHGRVFTSTELQNYFSGKTWYQQNPNFEDSELSDIESTNASFILDYQNTHNLTYEAQ